MPEHAFGFHGPMADLLTEAALFDPLGEDAKKTEQAERAVDRIRERMGSDAIERASLHKDRLSKRTRSTPNDA